MVGQPQTLSASAAPWKAVKTQVALKLPSKVFIPKAEPVVVEKPIEKPVDKVLENLKKFNITEDKEISEIK